MIEWHSMSYFDHIGVCNLQHVMFAMYLSLHLYVWFVVVQCHLTKIMTCFCKLTIPIYDFFFFFSDLFSTCYIFHSFSTEYLYIMYKCLLPDHWSDVNCDRIMTMLGEFTIPIYNVKACSMSHDCFPCLNLLFMQMPFYTCA